MNNEKTSYLYDKNDGCFKFNLHKQGLKTEASFDKESPKKRVKALKIIADVTEKESNFWNKSEINSPSIPKSKRDNNLVLSPKNMVLSPQKEYFKNGDAKHIKKNDTYIESTYFLFRRLSKKCNNNDSSLN